MDIPDISKDVVTQQPPTATLQVTSPAATQKPLSREERIPSNWDLKPKRDEDGEEVDGEVDATCNASGRTFVGTVADFNALLKS